jgi:hypothetical protein
LTCPNVLLPQVIQVKFTQPSLRVNYLHIFFQFPISMFYIKKSILSALYIFQSTIAFSIFALKLSGFNEVACKESWQFHTNLNETKMYFLLLKTG